LKAEISQHKQLKFVEVERATRLKSQLDLEKEDKTRLDRVIGELRE
jgi:uncharacterized membrane protein